MRYTRAEISRVSRIYGNLVEGLPLDLDGPQLLWAIAGVESSFGANSRAVFEPAYGPTGRYAHAINWERYGKVSASSLGPWQLMFVNCPPHFVPGDMEDLDKAAAATVWFLNRQIKRFKPQNLATIGAIWNGGNPHARRLTVVQDYIRKLERAYRVSMQPEVVI